MDLFKTDSHTRIYHFTNGDSLVISNITKIMIEEDMISLNHGKKRTVIYRNNLNYFITED